MRASRHYAQEGAFGGRTREVDVWVGLDVGKKEHFADVLDNDGERLFARAVANSQAALETLLDRAAQHGTPGLVMASPARSPSSPWRWPPGVARRWRMCRDW